ncbi:MAG: hypothetical protein SGPRY_010128 [Prymnesium sp.]
MTLNCEASGTHVQLTGRAFSPSPSVERSLTQRYLAAVEGLGGVRAGERRGRHRCVRQRRVRARDRAARGEGVLGGSDALGHASDASEPGRLERVASQPRVELEAGPVGEGHGAALPPLPSGPCFVNRVC